MIGLTWEDTYRYADGSSIFFLASPGKPFCPGGSCSGFTNGEDAVLDVFTGVMIDANEIQSVLQFLFVITWKFR